MPGKKPSFSDKKVPNSTLSRRRWSNGPATDVPESDRTRTTKSDAGYAPVTEPDAPVARHDFVEMAGDIQQAYPAPSALDPPSKASKAASDQPLSPVKMTSPRARDGPGLPERQKPQGSVSSQRQLNEYRERLARDLERRELSARGLLPNSPDKRVSPIQEEGLLSHPPALNTTATNASTESGNTIRGGMTPANVASTPSYPFPRMAAAGYGYKYYNHSAGADSRSSPIASFDAPYASQDRVLSNNSTPASTFTFHPPGISPQHENFDFPSPNLYDLSLMLSAEPGLDSWWNTVVQIMKDVYKAERVTLAIPADSTDVENVPWGQKATYNEHQEDELSLGYMGRSSMALAPSSRETPSTAPLREEPMTFGTPKRPDILTRHSFTSYEDNKVRSQDASPAPSRRPSYFTRSRSYYPQSEDAENLQDDSQLSKNALEEHDLLEGQQGIPVWEAPFAPQDQNRGRVLPVLQALNYEADPLIDHAGVITVLERGKSVTLTRTYPYLENAATLEKEKQQPPKTPGTEPARRPSKHASDAVSKRSGLFGSSTSSRGSNRGKSGSADKGKGAAGRGDDDEPRPPTPKYEEYEQAPPSPWSQSPAPSPAVRTDTKENPFFTDATVDEDSFNPGSAPLNYTGMPPPEAIGVDNSWTVLHIPLDHILSSKPNRPFRLNSAAVEQRAQGRGGDHYETGGNAGNGFSSDSPKPKPAPIAILSILTPVIPYPSNLRHSLDHLAPHMAATFSLCRQYENLATELAGMQRRRPSTTGFGAVAPDGRPLSSTFPVVSDVVLQPSHPGSMTSPSDYSGVSKSITGSPAGTPGWEQGSLGSIADKRQPAGSPAAAAHGGESYFSNKQRPTSVRHETFGSGSQTRPASKDSSTGERRQSRLSATKPMQDMLQAEFPDKTPTDPEDAPATIFGHRSSKSMQGSGLTSATQPTEDIKNTSTEQLSHEQGHYGHTMLHSYGADFAATFQSLPPSSSLLSRPPPSAAGVSRSVSYISGVDMPPPSDRLKGLMLDALPAHVFVALPQTGEIVWVNSRYLSYRGQTVADLTVDPWSSIHPDDCDEYLKAWGHSLRTGEQFSRTVRIKRFDGQYRWFHARAVASKDKRGVIMQFLGSYMDIHDQHIAELKAARQEEIEVSEAKHRLLANLIPQIIFTATEEDGITFANEQWLSYTGQSFEDSLGLGFLDYVHPLDLAACRLPFHHVSTPTGAKHAKKGQGAFMSPDLKPSSTFPSTGTPRTPDKNLIQKALSRQSSSTTSSVHDVPTAELSDMAKKGLIKVTTDSNGRLSYTTEVRLRSKAGEYRWHLIRCVEIDTIDFGTGASSYFGSATDINDLKNLENQLKEAMESKGRFLSNMSHEIRTPLIGISGMVSFLQDTILNEEQRDYTNTIQTSANSLLMIINDILDLSKVDAGMMKLKYEWFHTRSLIEDVNELVSAMAIAKGLELNYLVEADVPPWVKGDKVRIRQVLLNVIGNAIKFTSQGEVFSLCKVYTQGAPGTNEHEIMLEYSIIDTGQGFTKEESELIFKPFSQIDGSSTRQHGGSGLGLVISKQLVELHGGNMSGTAVPGKGSTFVFTARFALPTAEDHPDLPGSPSSTAQSVPSRQTSTESVPGNFQPLPPPKHFRNIDEASMASTDQEHVSPDVGSNGSSNFSATSGRSQVTDKTSVTSVNTGLARFSEAAKASGQDLSQMTLEMPSGRSSPAGRTATPSQTERAPSNDMRPPVYSILIICPQKYSREATKQHIEMTLPSDVPHQITALASVEESQTFTGGDDPIKFTHIVINLGSAEAVLSVMKQVSKSQKMDKTTILVLSDSTQRQSVLKLAANTPQEKLLTEHQVNFIYKPVKPSRFGVIFDPDKMRDLSIDRNRSTAQQMVESQKASYMEIEKRMGHKGYKVLLVEDNPLNQKVLMKYLKKIGVIVEVAVDGAECTSMVLSRPQNYYSLILVSSPLHCRFGAPC